MLFGAVFYITMTAQEQPVNRAIVLLTSYGQYNTQKIRTKFYQFIRPLFQTYWCRWVLNFCQFLYMGFMLYKLQLILSDLYNAWFSNVATCHDFLGITVIIIPDYSPRNLVNVACWAFKDNLLTLTVNDFFLRLSISTRKLQPSYFTLLGTFFRDVVVATTYTSVK